MTWFNAATGQSGTATGTTSWSASIGLSVGANPITVSAFDAAGNSSTAAITVYFTIPTPPALPEPASGGSHKRACGGSAGASGANALWLAAITGLILALAARRNS